jgi:hypothetical protein
MIQNLFIFNNNARRLVCPGHHSSNHPFPAVDSRNLHFDIDYHPASCCCYCRLFMLLLPFIYRASRIP